MLWATNHMYPYTLFNFWKKFERKYRKKTYVYKKIKSEENKNI